MYPVQYTLIIVQICVQTTQFNLTATSAPRRYHPIDKGGPIKSYIQLTQTRSMLSERQLNHGA